MPAAPTWQTVSIPFVGGVDTKTSPPLVLNGRLLQAKNCIMNYRGRVEKRYGFSRLPASPLTTASWCDSFGVGTPGSTLLDQELLIGGSGTQYGYSPASSSWMQNGTVQPWGVTTKTAYAGTTDCQGVDLALNFDTPTAGGEYACYAYTKASGGVWFSVFDDNTGQNVMPDTQLDPNAHDPRVVSIGPWFCIIVQVGEIGNATLVIYRINPFQKTVVGPVPLLNNYHVNTFDARAVAGSPVGNAGQYIAVAYAQVDGISGGYILGFDPWALAISTPAANFTTFQVLSMAVSVFAPTGLGFPGRVAVIFNTQASVPASVYLQWFDLSLNADNSQTVDTFTNAGAPWGKLTLGQTPGGWTAFMETLAVQDSAGDFITMPAIRTATGLVNSSATVTATFCKRGQAIAGDMFSLNGVVYLPTVYQGNYGATAQVYTQMQSLQPEYLLLQGGTTEVARFAQDNAAGPAQFPRCPRVSTDLAGNVVWGCGLRTQMTAGFNGQYQIVRSVGRAVFEYEVQPFSETLGDSLFLTGGFLSSYDGSAFVEDGFHLDPEPPVADLCNIGCVRVQMGTSSGGLAGGWVATVPGANSSGVIFTSVGNSSFSVRIISDQAVVGLVQFTIGAGNQINISFNPASGPFGPTEMVAFINGTTPFSTPAAAILAIATVATFGGDISDPLAYGTYAAVAGPTMLTGIQVLGVFSSGAKFPFTATLTFPVIPGSVKIVDSVAGVLATDGIGQGQISNINGGANSGTVVYSTGALSITLTSAPTNGTITATWSFQTSGFAEINDVYFPPDTLNPFGTVVASGWQVRPSSYVVITAQSTGPGGTPWTGSVSGGPCGYVYFTVDGNGSNPAPFSALVGVPCALLSTDIAAVCAQKFRQAVLGSYLANQVSVSSVVQNVQPPTGASAGSTSKVTLTCVIGQSWSTGTAVTYSEDFRIDMWRQASSSGFLGGSWMECPPGRKIMPGGYFVVPAGYDPASGNPSVIVFYFQVSYDGGSTYIGASPQIASLVLPSYTPTGVANVQTVIGYVSVPATLAPIPIQVLSNGTPQSVASAIQAVMAAYGAPVTYSADLVPGFEAALLITLNVDMAVVGPTQTLQLTPYNISSTGILPDGLYPYQNCFEWPDAKGQFHQSGTSLTTLVNVQGASPTFDPFGVAYSAAGSALSQASDGHGMLLWGSPVGGSSPFLIMPSLWATQKQFSTIAVYRGLVSVEGALYRVTDAAQSGTALPTSAIVNPVPTNPNATTVNPLTGSTLPPDILAFIETTPDAQAQYNAALYTNGGVEQNAPVPSCSFLHQHRQRLWAVLRENPNQLWYSQTFAPESGFAVNFSEALYVDIEAAGGNIVGLGTIDTWLIVLCQYRLYAISGDGPTAAGQGDFNPPNQIMSDAGCVSAGSIVQTPDGLWFQSSKGLYFISRELQVTFAGSDFNDLIRGKTINASVLMPNSTNLRWFCSAVAGAATAVSDYALSENYFLSFKSQFMNWAGNSCCLWSNRLVWVDSLGNVNVETPGSYLDNGAPITFLVQTAWQGKEAGLQGYIRVPELIMLGQMTGAGSASCLVQAGWDYEPPSAQIEWSEQNILSPAIGSNGDDGGDQPPLPDGTRFQFRGFLPDGPSGGCSESIGLTISDQMLTANYGGFALDGIQLKAGFFPGNYRLGSARTAT